MDERVKSFFKGLFVMAFWALLTWWAWSTISEDYRVSVHGKQTVGRVVGYKPEMHTSRRTGTRTYYYHTLTYENRSQRFDLGKQYPIGTQLYVLYLPSDPLVARIAKSDETLFQLIKGDLGRWWIGLLIGIVGIPFLGVMHFVAAVKPKSGNTEQAENGA